MPLLLSLVVSCYSFHEFDDPCDAIFLINGNEFFENLCRMDEMMRGQRGWRELAVLGDKINKFTGMIEGLLWSPRNGEGSEQVDDWAFEEVSSHSFLYA